MRKHLVIGLVLIASLSACSSAGSTETKTRAADAQETSFEDPSVRQPQDPTFPAWTQAQKDELIAGCAQVGVGSDVDTNKMRAYCECSAETISQKYSYDDAKKLDQEALTNQEKMNELMEAVSECFIHMQ